MEAARNFLEQTRHIEPSDKIDYWSVYELAAETFGEKDKDVTSLHSLVDLFGNDELFWFVACEFFIILNTLQHKCMSKLEQTQ